MEDIIGKVAGIRTALIVLAVAVMVAGCGGNGATLVNGGGTSPALDQGLDDSQAGWLSFPPVIDGNYSEYRLTSESELTVEGNDYAEAHGAGNYEIPATEDYVIVSGSDDPLAWAVYHLAELDAERPVSLHFTIEEAGESVGADPLPLGCWVGVTDYTTAGWEWYGPFVQPATLVINSANNRDRYVSAEHVMSFAMLTCSSSRYASPENPAGRTAALIDCSVIATLAADDEDYLATRPHYAAIDDMAFGDSRGASALNPSTQYVNLYWEHVYDPANDENEALLYKVYRKGLEDDERIPIGSVNAPEAEYTDPTDNATGVPEPLPGVTYMYYLRAYNPAGYTAYDAVPVTIPDDLPHNLNITAFTIRIENAFNGIGFDPELFNEDNDEGSIDANAATNLSLEWIEGTFEGEPFSGEDDSSWPWGMSQEDYNLAFNAARGNLMWLPLVHAGAAEFRRTGDWLVLDSAEELPVTGDPGPGVIFPDDDPESTGLEAEAKLQTYLPDSFESTYPNNGDLEVIVPYAIPLEVTMDIGFDPAAAALLEYLDGGGDPLTELNVSEDSFVRIPLEWGVGGEPADLSEMNLELHEYDAADGLSNGAIVEFTYTESPLDTGEYSFTPVGEETHLLCVVPGAALALGKYYAFRLSDGACWSSINMPADMLLGAGTEPPPPDLVTVPEHCWPDIDVLQVFYQDPVVRRNPNVYYDFGQGALMPVDEVAFNDVLKTNGDEFFLHISGGIYPKAAVMETDNPDLITSLSDGISGVTSAEESPGRIIIDIALLTLNGSPGDPTRVYSYKFFTADGSAVGQGSFDVVPIGSLLTAPVGVAWGVNVWDREEKEIADRTYNNFTTDGSTVGTTTPDVLWFEITGGSFFDYDQDEDMVHHTYPAEFPNMLVHVKDLEDDEVYYMEGAMRIAGIGESGSYLIIHTITNLDWHWPGVPGWPGRLDTDNHFELSLDDPHYPGLEFTFSEELLVTGQNPNEL